MNYFNLYWSWHEDYSPNWFAHENKTDEQFAQDVKDMLIKYGEEYMASETSWVGAHDWIEYVVKKMPELGYEKINPFSFGFFGGYILDGKKYGDKKELCEEEVKWRELVGEELYNKAVEKNKRYV